MNKKIMFSVLSLAISLVSCGEDPHKLREKKIGKKLDFSTIVGIKYYEVKRRFSTGLSFNEMGFQQEPTWIIEFKSNDTVSAWSPQKQRMQPFYLLFDHGNVYNFAKEYFRIKKITKDSLLFQRLHLKGKEISSDIRSDVNIVYYSEDYIKNTLKTTAQELQKPTAADTAYIESLITKSNQNPTNAKTAFAGRQPVIFTPTSLIVQVKKISTVNTLMGRTESYDYLFPKYRIEISRAYQDFAYELSAVVDDKGRIHMTKLYFVQPEFLKSKAKAVQGILDIYVRNLFKVTAGSTLSKAHSSEIKIILIGKK
ncbi:MAG: hypothetical protein H7223_08895 [Pedobacter sp.]|nr:hypothetical protein [Pedobacter sp.]